MGDQITTAMVDGYKSGIEMLLQQKGSKMRSLVRRERQEGVTDYYDQVGTATVNQVTNRHGDSPYNPVEHARRQVTTADYDTGEFIDKFDKVRVLNDPSSAITNAQGMAMGRKIDEVLFDAAFGTALIGGGPAANSTTSITFETGLTPTAGSTEGHTIVHNSTGLTFTKLRQAKAILDDNEVDDGDRHIVCSSAQIDDLLNEEKMTSADYANVKALVHGQVNTFLGFNFTRVNSAIVPVASNIRDVLCFGKGGLLLSEGISPTARITERGDKRFSWYAYYCMAVGATRMQGGKVIKIECDES